MSENMKLRAAEEYFSKAYHYQVDGKLDEAIDYYLLSIEIYPTAEAHTFLGWAYSVQGKLEKAIEECYSAISISPEYGNPYNDIGSYLITLGRIDEAILWLEMALKKISYGQHQFPLFNLGLIYEKKGEWGKAAGYYKKSADKNPEYETAKRAYYKIVSLLN